MSRPRTLPVGAEVRVVTERLVTLRLPFEAPPWWKGHRITFKVYPEGDGTTGRSADLLCDPEGGRQRRCPWGAPGALVRLFGLTGQRSALEFQYVELDGQSTVERWARSTWLIEARFVDTDLRPSSLSAGYEDLPARAKRLMVEQAQRRRSAHLKALGPLHKGDVLLPAWPRAPEYRMTLLADADLPSTMFQARIDRGAGDVREGHYDIDPHRGRLYGGPVWRRP